MKAHDKDSGNASKHAKPAPSNFEKSASAELYSPEKQCLLTLLFLAKGCTSERVKAARYVGIATGGTPLGMPGDSYGNCWNGS
ncbi:hypothetical protein SDJN02_27112, partial [Cucurbita argyrosperma subsp. argyrosperma]